MRDADSLPGAIMIRVQAQSAFAIRNRLIVVAELPMNGGPAVPAFGEGGITGD